MLIVAFVLIFCAGFLLYVGIRFDVLDPRPTLKIYEFGAASIPGSKKKDSGVFLHLPFLRWIAIFNKPLISRDMRRQMTRDLGLGHTGLTPEEHFLKKELLIIIFLWISFTFLDKSILVWGCVIAVLGGWIFPDMMLRSKINKAKDQIVRLLPDTVDLLGLCVNAGLDFMMALKWVVEKSTPSVLIYEMNHVLQEINVGKPRRDALRDLAQRYDLPDLSTFSRTLIQADKMGTSVSEALTILSEDMRLARYRRGEAMAMKAPLKMLIPLLFCIFPVVGILVAAPVFLDFMLNNPLKNLAGS